MGISDGTPLGFTLSKEAVSIWWTWLHSSPPCAVFPLQVLAGERLRLALRHGFL